MPNLTYKKGDLLKEDVQALVNTVNCVGVMGRGIALQFKKSFPENFKAYADACKREEVIPGQMFVFETGRLLNPRFIINFPTKRHWRGKSRMEDIETGLQALAEEIRLRKIESIAIPPLGSGLGGLDWSQVRPQIETALAQLDVRLVVFEPNANAPKSQTRSKAVPNMTEGRAALVGLFERYQRGLLDPSVTLLELHKLMYFMQEAGEPLRLKYAKAHFGPYAENLRHVLNAIEGHLVSGYADGGDDPSKTLTLVPGALHDANRFLESKPKTLAKFERVTELVEGFETPFGLELLSTVHWVTTHEATKSFENVVAKVYEWNSGKKQFSKRQIGLAAERLVAKGWCPTLETPAQS